MFVCSHWSVHRGDPVGDGVTGQLPEVRSSSLTFSQPMRYEQLLEREKERDRTVVAYDMQFAKCKLGERTKVKRTKNKHVPLSPQLRQEQLSRGGMEIEEKKKKLRDMINRVREGKSERERD